MLNKIIWAVIVIAIIGILYAWLIANGPPPADYLKLFGVIAIGLGVLIIVTKKL